MPFQSNYSLTQQRGFPGLLVNLIDAETYVNSAADAAQINLYRFDFTAAATTGYTYSIGTTVFNVGSNLGSSPSNFASAAASQINGNTAVFGSLAARIITAAGTSSASLLLIARQTGAAGTFTANVTYGNTAGGSQLGGTSAASSSNIPFGRLVQQNAASDREGTMRLPNTSNSAVLLGVVIGDHSREMSSGRPDAVAEVQANQNAAVLRKGEIWVPVEVPVGRTSPVSYRFGTETGFTNLGLFGTASSANVRGLLVGSRYDSDSFALENGQLIARLSINIPQ